MRYGTLVRLEEGCELSTACREKFEGLRSMGMDSCQLIYKPAVYELSHADVIRDAAEAAGIELSAMFCGYYDRNNLWDNQFDLILAGINSPIFGADRIKYLLSAIPFLQRLGVTDMVIHAGFLPNHTHDSGYSLMRAAVALLGTRLKEAGCNLLFETGMESPIALLNLISDCGLDNLYVNLDTANFIIYGYGNPVDAMYTIGSYVRNVHAKDAMPPTMPHSRGKEVPVGTGLVDFERIFDLLYRQGYDRFITIEREIRDAKQEEGIAEALHYLKKIEEKVKVGQ